MAYVDRIITCVSCGQGFTFSASEQELFASRGFTNEPKRCPECRAQRRATMGGSDPMRDTMSSTPRLRRSRRMSRSASFTNWPAHGPALKRPSRPTGWSVPGCSTGGGGAGRSASRLYQVVGMPEATSHAATLARLREWGLPVEPHWRRCEGIDEVLAFCQAAPTDGGAGALLGLLRGA